MAKLSNKQLNDLLQSAFENAAPDKAEEIVSAAEKKNSAITVSIVQEDYKRKYMKSAALIAAGLVIVIGLIVTMMLVHNNTPYATISIESDRCIEISLNSDYRPVSLGGPDNMSVQMAQQIAKGADLEETVDNILDAMRESGSLSENSNTVLITADAPEDAEKLLSRSFDAVRDSFVESDYDGAILTTIASKEDDLTQMAHRHRISVGKAEMVSDIRHKVKNLRTELLCRLSVNDLNLLSLFSSIIYDDIGVYGESRGCIAPAAAIRYVCSEAGIDDANAVITMGVDEYGLIYSITVHGKDRVYIYRLDADSGEILTVSQGDDLQAAQMADRNTPSPKPSSDKKPSVTEPTEQSTSPQSIRILPANSPDRPAATQVVRPESGAAHQDTTTAPTDAKTQNPTFSGQPSIQNPTKKPQPATQKPTQRVRPTEAPKATEAPRPATTQPPVTSAPTQAKQEPAIFTSKNYLPSGGVQSDNPLTSEAKQISIRRILNGYNLFYDSDSFPYTSPGKQGGISALVCSREQFKKLTGSTDSRYDDNYFKTRVLYIYMNRDANYHWVKSITAAYMQGGTLCLKNSEPVGYYIPAGSADADRIYTVVYELNKSDLSDLTSMVEFTG